MRFRRKIGAFTLLELMVVITIIAALAVVAIPMLSQYLRKSKTSEARLNLRKIYDGEVSYYQEEFTTAAGIMLTKEFVDCGPSPASPPGKNKHMPDWEDLNWPLVKFATDGPVWYSYSVVTSGIEGTAAFTARAEGDIDEDGTTSLFERVAVVNSSTGEVEGGAAIYVLDEEE